MKHHRVVIPVLIGLLAAASCGGPPPPQGPTPEEIEAARQDSIRQAREDSIRRAQGMARQDSIRQAQMEAQRQREMAAREAAEARDILTTMIHFDFDKSNIRPDAEQILMKKVAVLRANPDARLRIAGYADERGSVEYNLALGQRRADAAKNFLVGFGLDPSRFETVSYGESDPIADGHNEDAWAQNRRDQFTVLGNTDNLKSPGS